MNLSDDMPIEELIQYGLGALADSDYAQARDALGSVVNNPRAHSNALALQQAAEALERIGEYPLAWKGLDLLGRLERLPGPADWEGEPLAGQTLLIEQRVRHTGAVIRMGQLIAAAAKQAGHCIVLVEPRLKPLFERSFPGVTFLDSNTDRTTAYAQCDVRASYETLCRYLVGSRAAIEAGFTPLRAALDRTSAFRARYLRGAEKGTKLIGISWRSLNPDKDILTLDQWADLLPRLGNARFVSIQYGDNEDQADMIAAASGCPVLHDPEVDQFNLLDEFAAQVAALDAVVSISNTACHVAGALGIPSIVLVDQRPALVWNILTQRQPWYPRTATVRYSGEHWSAYRRRILDAVWEFADLPVF